MTADDLTGPFAALVIVVVAAGFAWRAFVAGEIIPGLLWQQLMEEQRKLREALERIASAHEKSNEVNAALLEERRRELRDG